MEVMELEGAGPTVYFITTRYLGHLPAGALVALYDCIEEANRDTFHLLATGRYHRFVSASDEEFGRIMQAHTVYRWDRIPGTARGFLELRDFKTNSQDLSINSLHGIVESGDRMSEEYLGRLKTSEHDEYAKERTCIYFIRNDDGRPITEAEACTLLRAKVVELHDKAYAYVQKWSTVQDVARRAKERAADFQAEAIDLKARLEEEEPETKLEKNVGSVVEACLPNLEFLDKSLLLLVRYLHSHKRTWRVLRELDAGRLVRDADCPQELFEGTRFKEYKLKKGKVGCRLCACPVGQRVEVLIFKKGRENWAENYGTCQRE